MLHLGHATHRLSLVLDHTVVRTVRLLNVRFSELVHGVRNVNLANFCTGHANLGCRDQDRSAGARQYASAARVCVFVSLLSVSSFVPHHYCAVLLASTDGRGASPEVTELEKLAVSAVAGAKQLPGEVAQRFVDQVKASVDKVHAADPTSAEAARLAVKYAHLLGASFMCMCASL